jgi:hypothetical protein
MVVTAKMPHIDKWVKMCYLYTMEFYKGEW